MKKICFSTQFSTENFFLKFKNFTMSKSWTRIFYAENSPLQRDPLNWGFWAENSGPKKYDSKFSLISKFTESQKILRSQLFLSTNSPNTELPVRSLLQISGPQKNSCILQICVRENGTFIRRSILLLPDFDEINLFFVRRVHSQP